MSTTNPVLYGRRLYGRTTYSENADPQTFNVTLSETISESDALGKDVSKPLTDAMTLLDAYVTMMTVVKTDTMTLSDARAITAKKVLSDSLSPADTFVVHFMKVLSDIEFLSDSTTITTHKALSESMTLSEVFAISFGKVFMDTVTLADSIAKTSKLKPSELMALSDTFSKTVRKALSETITTSDAKAFTVSKLLSEFINSMDSPIILTVLKALMDIILIQDWISIRLMQPTIWTTAQNPPVGYSSLYGRTLYGVKLYSGLHATVWIAIKPTVAGNGWTNFNEETNE